MPSAQETASASQAFNNLFVGKPTAPAVSSPSPTPPAMAESIARSQGSTTLPNPTNITPEQFMNPVPMTQANPINNPQVATNLKQAFNEANQSGTPPPQTAGDAASAINQFNSIATQTPSFYKPDPNNAQVFNAKGEPVSYEQFIAQGGKADFSNVTAGNAPAAQGTPLNGIEQQLAADPGYQQLLKSYGEFNSIVEKSKTLTETYDEIVKKSGLEAINMELVNMKSVIEGTEDDIRNEVKAAAGFATDSQVMALAQARNKTLIKSYNKLVDQQAMIKDQVNTMINLAGQDRQFAMQTITQKLQIDQQILDYRDKFSRNAREGYQNYINAVGYSGMYTALMNDPKSLAMAEKTMGLPSGTIYQGAQKELKAQQEKKKQQDFENSIQLAQLNVSRGNLAVAQQNAETNRIQALASLPQPGQVSEKTRTALQSNPDYKVIGQSIPTIQALKAYKSALEKHGSWSSNSAARGELQSTYGDAIVAWKTAAGLGALSGFDFGLAENVVPNFGMTKRNAKLTSQLDTAISLLEKQATTLSNRLGRLMPDAKPLLDEDLDHVLVLTRPNEYKLGPDGKVYKITN